ncbi:MAG: hypothetical protein ACI8P9_001564 [Parasphingorhabdus sp.]|jgi:hypothetical protein
MHWILLSIVAVLLIAMAGRYPRVAFSLLAILIAGAAGLYHLVDEELVGMKQIDITDVGITDIKLNSYYADGFRISGNIRNQSVSQDVSEVDLHFSVLDCPEASVVVSESECNLITELTRKVRIHVPFSETTKFETTIQPGELKITGERRWKFKIVGVTGRTPLR